MNIYQKISAVMQDIQYLAKDDKVSFGNTNYKAISEEKVTAAVRESLVKNGIVIMPTEQSHHKEGNLSTVDVTYRIQNIDEPEDYVTVMSSGTGADSQDKGVGKAMTYAYKYMLLRTFAIPTGEDPDKISSAELDDKQAKKKAAEEATQAKLATPQQMGILKDTAKKRSIELSKLLKEMVVANAIDGKLYDAPDGDTKVLSAVDVLVVMNRLNSEKSDEQAS